MNPRQGEQSKSWFRSDRFYSVSGNWYFTTREAMELGPFPTKKDAEAELMLFMRKLHNNDLPASPLAS